MASSSNEKPDNIIVREWRLEDLPSVYELCKKFEKTQGMRVKSLSDKTLAENGFCESPWYHGCLAETTALGKQVIIGFGMACFYYDMGRALRIECLYTEPEWRRFGVGKKLMGTLVKFGLENECESINWVSMKDNVPANSFYNKIGKQKGPVSECYARCKGGKLGSLNT